MVGLDSRVLRASSEASIAPNRRQSPQNTLRRSNPVSRSECPKGVKTDAARTSVAKENRTVTGLFSLCTEDAAHKKVSASRAPRRSRKCRLPTSLPGFTGAQACHCRAHIALCGGVTKKGPLKEERPKSREETPKEGYDIPGNPQMSQTWV